jgi:hypothetical protein
MSNATAIQEAMPGNKISLAGAGVWNQKTFLLATVESGFA